MSACEVGTRLHGAAWRIDNGDVGPWAELHAEFWRNAGLDAACAFPDGACCERLLAELAAALAGIARARKGERPAAAGEAFRGLLTARPSGSAELQRAIAGRAEGHRVCGLQALLVELAIACLADEHAGDGTGVPASIFRTPMPFSWT